MSFRPAEVERLRKSLPSYLVEITPRKTHGSRIVLFADFLRDVLGIEARDFSKDMEIPVKSQVLLARGRVDAVFGNLIIEFKVNLDQEIDDARTELEKYFQALKEKHPDTNYVGMATDGVKFRIFKPVFAESKLKKIVPIDQLDLSTEAADAEEVYLWFDSYFFTAVKIPPTTEDLRRRFGVDSPTFAFMKDELSNMLHELKSDRTVKTKLDRWERYLEIVYGDKLASSELFIKHTYLATLAKVIVYLRLYPGELPSKQDVQKIIDGKMFHDFGIANFVEEDFFAWVLHPRIRERVNEYVFKILGQLVIYDLAQIDEDVFKELYQELIDPEVRHDLGEYYTPDWLAEYMLSGLVDSSPRASILDPACGSGTFLFSAVKLVVQKLKADNIPDDKILEHILTNVVGVDIHPLAVIISRTNYLLALRDLLGQHRGEVNIPVYLSDSIRLPEVAMVVQYGVKVYRVRVDKKTFFALPMKLADAPAILDEIISLMYRYAKAYELKEQSKKEVRKAFSSAVKLLNIEIEDRELRLLDRNFDTLLQLIDTKRNSIWTFILRNIYKPIALSHRKFDYLVGNPPWLSMRYMKDPDYQEFLKSESIKYGLVDKKSVHLLGLIELASLFFKKTVDIYLKAKGTISFVMPKGTLLASQHVNFRKFESVNVVRILDLERVEPLFNVPSCVITAEKVPA